MMLLDQGLSWDYHFDHLLKPSLGVVVAYSLAVIFALRLFEQGQTNLGEYWTNDI